MFFQGDVQLPIPEHNRLPYDTVMGIIKQRHYNRYPCNCSISLCHYMLKQNSNIQGYTFRRPHPGLCPKKYYIVDWKQPEELTETESTRVLGIFMSALKPSLRSIE